MKRCLFIVFFLSLSLQLCAYRWPVNDVLIYSTFGIPGNGFLQAGLEIGGPVQDVFPIEDGEVVFQYDEERENDIPSCLGNYVVVEHEGKIRSIYAHVKDGHNVISGEVDEDERLGSTGNSGYTTGNKLYLQIIDSELGQSVNPELILPPVPDKRRPVIEEISILGPDGDEYRLGESETLISIQPGLYSCDVRAYDVCEHVPFFLPMTPYRIIVKVNGETVSDLRFDAIKNSEDRASKSGMKLLSEVVSEGWHFILGEFRITNGQNLIEVAAWDFSGNGTEKTHMLEAR